MRFKLIVGDRRFQVDEISEIELVYYECEYKPGVSGMRFIVVPQVSDEISCTLKLEDTTKHTPYEVDPIIGATFRRDGSELGGIRFQLPAKYFHSFKNPSKYRGFWKKVDCVDDLFICSSRNILILRSAIITGAEQVSNETASLTFKFEHFETFPIELLDKVIERSYKKEET